MTREQTDTEAFPDRWYTTNLVGEATALLASVRFNENPHSLHVHGTRESHRGLFRLLDDCGTLQDAAEVFEHYMEIQFDLRPPPDGEAGSGAMRFVASYLKLLRGWGFDSGSPQGAVLKGWVESRFGLVPVYHKEILGAFPSDAWITYLEEKMSSRFHDGVINFQLDLLYEYCQWALARFHAPGARTIRLWRGTNDCPGQVVEGDPWSGTCILRLNNLVSFTDDEERAEEFGDWMIEAAVPTAKLLYFPGLLRDRVFNSEGEYLVIGGNYRVRTARGGRWLTPRG